MAPLGAAEDGLESTSVRAWVTGLALVLLEATWRTSRPRGLAAAAIKAIKAIKRSATRMIAAMLSESTRRVYIAWQHAAVRGSNMSTHSACPQWGTLIDDRLRCVPTPRRQRKRRRGALRHAVVAATAAWIMAPISTMTFPESVWPEAM